MTRKETESAIPNFYLIWSLAGVSLIEAGVNGLWRRGLPAVSAVGSGPGGLFTPPVKYEKEREGSSRMLVKFENLKKLNGWIGGSWGLLLGAGESRRLQAWC